eukprot:CAMPEP_0115341542 /NCGR_PEP_ID=MMETSP0270-20121206/91730_1 /TAXON_ID=71861 /ORGANISM="Scrippsiella trochoidea, Strain CCMP3099" /LENGTH=247 /DNA_ID=CAMNT_0002763059 /DNA_START=6 /DNA_END=746 /DNA_ORIENTATION=+
MESGALDKVSRDIFQREDGVCDLGEPQTQLELAAFKSELQPKVFSGLQRALDSGADSPGSMALSQEYAAGVDVDTGFSRQSTQEPEDGTMANYNNVKSNPFCGMRQGTVPEDVDEVGRMKRKLRGVVFGGLERTMESGDLEKVFQEIVQHDDAVCDLGEPQTQLELGAFKSELQPKVFRGLQRALDSGALEDVFREISGEVVGDHSDNTANEQPDSLNELAAFKHKVQSKFFSGVERALDNGALEDA